jgi:hypothetical protein
VKRRPVGMRGWLISVGAVVIGLGAAYGAGTVTHPATIGSRSQAGQETRADVTSQTRACPSPGTVGLTAAKLATVSLPGSAHQGSAVVTRLSGGGSATAGKAVATLDTPGALRLTRVPAAPKLRDRVVKGGSTSDKVVTTRGRGGVMVQASGALAQGLEVEQTSPNGLVTAQCQAPGTDFWFVGPGQTVAGQIQLYLMNTDDQPASAEVDAVTDSGPVLGGSADSGIVVPPHGIVGQSLGKLLASSRVIALHVTTSTGRVVAAVRMSKRSGAEGNWLPATQEPSRQLVIPGLPSTSGTRVLYLTTPGSISAQVKVTAITARGSYVPAGGNSIDLPGQSVLAARIPSLAGVACALRITSNVPITASVMLPGGAAGSPGAFSAAAPPVSEQGIAADSPAGRAGSASLIISAPRTTATVRIGIATSSAAFSRQGGTVVHVPAGRTVVTRVKPPGRKPADFSAVVIPQPGSGPVYVARVTTTGGLIRSILPVTSALTWVPLPLVSQALDTVSSGR